MAVLLRRKLLSEMHILIKLIIVSDLHSILDVRDD